jgi:hypothetical protein
MCDDRELGFEIKTGYIAKLSLAQIMYLRKMNPGVILRIPAKRIYNYDSSASRSLVPDLVEFIRKQVAY